MFLFFFADVNRSPLHVSPQITKQQLQQTKDRFQAFLNGDTQIVADEAFINAVQSYTEVSAASPSLNSALHPASLPGLSLPSRTRSGRRVLKWWLKLSAV